MANHPFSAPPFQLLHNASQSGEGITADGVYKLLGAHFKAPNPDRQGSGAPALRAMTVTHALEHDADIAEVQEWVGHANMATVRLHDCRKMRPEAWPTFKIGS